jgi:hypothetical protein
MLPIVGINQMHDAALEKLQILFQVILDKSISKTQKLWQIRGL